MSSRMSQPPVHLGIRLSVAIAAALVAGVLTTRTGTSSSVVAEAPTGCPDGTVEVGSGEGGESIPDSVEVQSTGILCQAAFTASGTFSTPEGVGTVDVLVVGGGGGGGLGGVVNGEVLAGGGGGGGQVSLYEGVPVTGDIAVTVGVGGAGGVDGCGPCAATGVDGTDGGGSEFGTSGVYVAGGGSGGDGGTTAGSSPFVVSGAGGTSPGVSVTSVPVGVIATVSSGGDGGSAAGDLMGPSGSVFYFSGAGGGAGAGGDGYDTVTSSPVSIFGGAGTARSVAAGDGGIGSLPIGGYFETYYWFFFDSWRSEQSGFTVVSDVYNLGFGPGGGGGLASLDLWVDDTYSDWVVYGTYAGGRDLAEGYPPLGYGAWLSGDNLDGQTPFVRPGTDKYYGACGWDDCDPATDDPPVTLGAGGGGASGNASLLTNPDIAPKSVAGADGGDGIVIVLFEQPVDRDGDGFLSDVDCNDDAPTVNPGAVEVVGNGFDDDCDVETPLAENTDLACDSAPTTTAVLANDGRRIDFSAIEAILPEAEIGSDHRYSSVTAIGGPSISTGVIDDIVEVGTGEWTSEITVGDATGVVAGDAVAATSDTGSLGHGSATVVTGVVGGVITVTTTGTTAPTAGDLVDIRFGEAVDAVITVTDIDGAEDVKYVDDGIWFGFPDYPYHTWITSNFDTTHAYNGAVDNIVPAGTGEWTFDITNVSATPGPIGLVPGDRVGFAELGTAFTGWFGTYTVVSVDDVNGVISMRAEGGVAPEQREYVEFGPLTFVEYTIEFFEGGTATSVELDGVALTAHDIGTHRFVEFDAPDRFTLPRVSAIEPLTDVDDEGVAGGALRFWSAAYTNWNSNESAHWVEAGFDEVSTITFRIGQMAAGVFNLNIDASSANSTAAGTDVYSCDVVTPKEIETSLTYTGDSGVVLAGTLVTLSSLIDPEECATPAVVYTLVSADGTERVITSPFNTSDLMSGIYEIVATYDGDGTCLPSEDRATLVVSSSADTVTGGGVYLVDGEVSGSQRVHFGFTVQRSEKLDRRTGARQVTQRGQLLWINNHQWRLKSAMYARWTVSSGGEISGDRPVFGSFPCPAGVGAVGSSPKCGTIAGGGWLERWNSDTAMWEVATDLGDDGWISFAATVYDGGKVTVCKGKRNCTIVDVADWFGMMMNGITTADEVPVSAPVEVRKQRNGSIVIRV